jgi:hypothetical protein
MGLPASATPQQALASMAGRAVLMLDTYELLGPLEAWLRDELLPQLPEQVLVVLSGREPPALAWRADAGWRQRFYTLPLRNLSPAESDEYLSRRQVPEEQRQRVLDFTHGHPLALSLVADLFEQRAGVQFQPEDVPDVVKTLLELFVQKVPSPAHRAVLEICALVRLTSEPLLASMLATEDAHELFEWLRGLSFIEATRQGLFPHDLARESLVADMRWRNPDWYGELRRRARAFYAGGLKQSSMMVQQQLLFEYIYLHRGNALVRPFFEWQQNPGLSVDIARPEDWPALVAMVAQHEGRESARWAELWLQRQPASTLVVREAASAGQPLAGFLMTLQLTPADAGVLGDDPATRAAWAFLSQYAALRSGEVALLFRFWMAADTYQQISGVQSLIGVQMVRAYLTTPGLAYSLFPAADAPFWEPLSRYLDQRRIAEADFTVGGRTYGVFGHDWRTTSPVEWLALMADRELAVELESAASAPARSVVALSEPLFAEAARSAIQEYARPDQLYASPLLYAHLITNQVSDDAPLTERVAMLRAVVRSACELLQHAPRDLRLYRALYHTYLQPAGTQERAAELLDIPFSSYRRHLKAGLARAVEILWSWETRGGPPVGPVGQET